MKTAIKLIDKLLGVYGSFPYHRGKYRILNHLVPLCKSNWSDYRLTKRLGLMWRLNLNDLIQRQIFYIGVYEYWETKFIKSVLKPGMVFCDVGANIGYYSLQAAKAVGPTGVVYAFEPFPITYDQLMYNIRLNKLKNIHAFKIALSDKKSKAFMVNKNKEINLGCSRLSTSDNDNERIEITKDTFSAFCYENNLNRIDVLKVDIEGHEGKFFEGAYSVIEKHKPIIITEINTSGLARYNVKPDYIKHYLENFGYKLYTFSRFNLVPIEDLHTSLSEYNIIAKT